MEMASGWFNMGNLMRLGLISIMLICVISSAVSAAVSMTGPATVTRGGVSIGEPNVDGYFNLSVLGSNGLSAPMHLGLVVNPQVMTGDICDRPPYLDNSSDPQNIILGNDAIVWPTDVANPFLFSQVSPNGIDAPSVGCWDVPWGGSRYYGLINTNNTTVRVGTLYPDIPGSNEFLATSLKPGSYTYHLQSDNVPSVPGVDSSDYTVEVTFGELSVGAYNFTAWSQGSLVPVSTIQAGNTVMLQGTNTDSQTTYLWLAGPCLPECGITITSLTVQDNPPVEGGAYRNGTWFYQWTAPCDGCEYTVYASSIDPTDVVSRMCNNNGGPCDLGTCGLGGICGLIDCPTCAPAPATVTITVTEPDFNVNLTEIVERCCCAAYPCGSSDPLTNISLTGQTGIPGQPVQVWLFGNSWIGSKPFLIGSFNSLLDSSGSFNLDLRQLMNEENINLCDIASGEYHVIVQIPGCNSRTFDVGPEFIPEDAIGYAAYQALLAKLEDRNQSLCLSCPPVKDQYIDLKFTLRDNCNNLGSVDFVGTPTEGLVKLPVQFTDVSTFVGDEFLWTFGDNATSTEQNPLHVYTTPGKFSVTLQKTNGTAVSSQEKINYITVSEVPSKYYEPIANFTWAITHATTGEVQYIDQSSASTPLTYLWEFGDGTTDTNVSPTYQYGELGIYNVSLTITDTFNKTSTVTVPVNVSAVPLYNTPQANFTFVPKNVDPMTIQFIDQSAGATELTHLWDFGDGSNSTEKVPAHTYQTPAIYTVTLTVTDTYGTVSVPNVQQVQVPASPSALPVIDFTADVVEGQYPLTVQFLDTTTTTWADSWQWSFGDGGVSSLRSPVHTYTTPGLYTVTLRAANVNGEGNEMTKENYINVQNQPPVITATADPMSGHFPLKVLFAATATVNNKSAEMTAPLIQSWLWDFGDNSISSAQNPEHIYETPGDYPVTVTCQLYDGVSSMADVGTIEVGPQPYANFYWDYLDKDETCCYLVKFTDTSVGAALWDWDFGDGLTSVEQNPTHRFKEVGYYNVTLTVDDGAGSKNVMTKQVQITAGYTTPTPTPTPTPVPGQVTARFISEAQGTRTIQFTDKSDGVIEGLTTWLWAFGDGGLSSDRNPVHTYPKDGEYSVTLKVNTGQFSDTEMKTVGVR